MHTVPQASQKKQKKWRKRIFAGLLIFLAVIILCGLIIHQTKGFKSYVFSRINNYLRTNAKMSISVRSFNYNVFRLSASFEDLIIIPLDPNNSLFQEFTATELSINLSYKTLFGKRIHIQKFHVTKPEVRLSKPERIPSITKKVGPASNKPFSFQIDEFLVESGKIDFQDNEFPITASIDDIALNIHFEKGDEIHKGILTTQSGKIDIFGSQFSLDEFLTEFAFDDHSIQIAQFLCDTEPFIATASGQIQNYQENPQYSFSMEGTLQLDFLNKISEREQNFAGILLFNTSINGNGEDLTFDGHVQAEDVLAADIPIKNLEGNFQGDRTRIALRNLLIEDTSGRLKGRMDFSLLEKGDSSAEFHWASLKISAIENLMPELAHLSSIGTSGFVAAKWRERTLDSLDADGEIRLESLKKTVPVSKEPIDLEGRVSFQAKNGMITLFPSSMRLNQTTLAISGSLSPADQFKMNFQLTSKDLRDTKRLLDQLRSQGLIPESMDLSQVQVDGQLHLSGEAAGSLDLPEATLKIAGRDIVLNTHEVGNIDAELTYAARTIDRISLSIRGEQGGMTMGGEISIDPFEKSFIPSAELRIKASDMEIAPFVSFITEKYSLQGSLSGEATLSGHMTDPSIQFFGVLNNFVGNNEDFSSIKIKGQYSKQNINLEEFIIKKGEGHIEGSLGLDIFARTFDIDIKGHAINLSTFRTINTGEKKFQGSVHLTLRGSGPIENPVFSLNLAMENISAKSVWVGSLVLKAVSDGRLVNIWMETPLGQTSVMAKLTLEEPYLVEGQIKTESMDIWHAMRSGLEPLPSPIASQISATADFVIPLNDWRNTTLSMNLKKGTFRYKDFEIHTPQPVHAKIQNRELILEDFAILGPQTEFTVSGSLPLTEKQASNIKITGSLNLRLLGALFPGTETAGVLNIEGSLSGSLLEPALNASMEMKNGHYISPHFPMDFQNITFKSEIEENVFRLDHLFIGIGEGNVSARGTIFLSPLLSGKSFSEPPIAERNEIIVSLNGLNLDRFAEILGDSLEAQIGGRVDGTARLHGDFFFLPHLQMEGELTRLEFSLDEFKISNEEKIQFGMRKGIFHLRKFRLSGGRSFFQAEGEVNLNPESWIDGQLSASLDSAVLSPFVEDAVLGGILALDLHLQGDLQSPVINGHGKISDGLFQMEEPSILITNFNGTLDFLDTETVNLSLEGIVNGGATNIQGKIVHRSFSILSARLEAKTIGAQLNYPEGFQAISDGTLTLEKKEKGWFLGGDIKINQSYYNSDIYPGGELINTLRTKRRALRRDIPPSIRSLNLDVNVSTVDAFIIENNLADLEMDGNIRVTGTVFDPRLSGFIQNKQTGQIVFGNHDYDVEQASLNFQNADPLEGQLSITAHTQIRHRDDNLKVTLTISGTITSLEFGLSSSPSRSELELASLLITGYGTERLRDDAAGVIGDQLMLYFLSPFASPFTNIVKNFLGAEEVSIEPINIASETDPGARFTFRKGLSHALDLIYSIDISNTQNQTWLLDYTFNKNFGIQSFAKDDGSYGGSLSHRFFLGNPDNGKSALYPSRHSQFTIQDIHFEGDLVFPESDLRRLSWSLKKGSVFSYKDMRKTINTLETFYKANNYLNAIIKPLLQLENSGSIRIVFNISPSSPAAIVFEGDSLSKKIKREVIDRWNGRLPEEMSLSHARKMILRDLIAKGHLDASVTQTKTYSQGKSVYRFSTNQGPKFRIREFDVEGQSSLSPKAIKSALSGIPKAKGKGLWVLVSDFKRAKLRIETLFAEYGYPNATINRPHILFDRDKNFIDITLPIDQGIQSRIFSIQIDGNSVFTDYELMDAMSLKEGSVFTPTYLASDTNRLYSLYRSWGFHDVNIDVQTISGPDNATTDLLYTIREGEIHTISSIEIRGNQRTPEHVIRRELTFKEGDILRTRDLITSQKKLYDLMIFSTVNIRREDNAERRGRPKIRIEVREDPRFTVSYGLRYNSEEKLEGFGQLDLTNILGRARNGLFFYRQNDRQKDFRFSLKDPYLFGQRLNTLYSFFYTEEIVSIFQEDQWGLSIQQQRQLSLHSYFSYLFRIKNIRSFKLESDAPYPEDIRFFLPEFQIFWVRDTRPNLLNAKQGSFVSLSLIYSPDFLKTDRKYISFFSQYSLYLPISRQVIWASNYRIGLASAFGQILAPRSLRYYAGGANSIRGFEREMVGPYDPILQVPAGGEGLFIVNQELRFPLFKLFEGVIFFDFGNIYENLRDFNPFDLRTGAGFGLRLNLPAIFLGLDYGINLAPQEYERRSVIYFSIGQAF